MKTPSDLLQRAEQYVTERAYNQALEVSSEVIALLQTRDLEPGSVHVQYDATTSQLTTLSLSASASRDLAHSLCIIGICLQHQGERTDALRYLHTAYESARLVVDETLQARVQNMIAQLHWMDFENDEAVNAAFLALGHAKHSSNKKHTATALTTIGLICHDFNDAPRALRYFDKARMAQQECADAAAVATLTSHMASAYLQNKQFTEAEETYRSALSMVDESTQSAQVAGIYCNLAIAVQQSGDLQRALEEYKRSLHLHQMNDFQPGIAGVSSNMAELAVERGDRTAALHYYEISEAAFYTMESTVSLTRVQWEIALLRIATAANPATIQQLDDLHTLYQRCEDAGVVDATVNRAYSDILAKHGRSHEAQTYANLAEQSAESEEDELQAESLMHFQSLMETLEIQHGQNFQ